MGRRGRIEPDLDLGCLAVCRAGLGGGGARLEGAELLRQAGGDGLPDRLAGGERRLERRLALVHDRTDPLAGGRHLPDAAQGALRRRAGGVSAGAPGLHHRVEHPPAPGEHRQLAGAGAGWADLHHPVSAHCAGAGGDGGSEAQATCAGIHHRAHPDALLGAAHLRAPAWSPGGALLVGLGGCSFTSRTACWRGPSSSARSGMASCWS